MSKLKSFSVKMLAILIAFQLTSCMTTKTAVGKYNEKSGQVYTYAKGKQFWLFWGIIPLGRTNVNTPGNGDCQVITKYNLLDFLIRGITCGVVSSYTIKIKAKKGEMNTQPQQKVQQQPQQININVGNLGQQKETKNDKANQDNKVIK